MVDSSLGALSDGIYGAELDRRISEATDAIREALARNTAFENPRLAAVLGSGLGGVVELLDDEPRVRLSYGDIPHVPGASIPGEAGSQPGH